MRKRKAKPKTTVLYVRVAIPTHGRLRAIAISRSYPHTINSVAREALELGLSALEDTTSTTSK